MELGYGHPTVPEGSFWLDKPYCTDRINTKNSLVIKVVAIQRQRRLPFREIRNRYSSIYRAAGIDDHLETSFAVLECAE